MLPASAATNAVRLTAPTSRRIARPFFNGTKAALAPGILWVPGRISNFGENRTAGHIYRVQPTGPFEDDPNLTDRKFPGNPTRAYRSTHPLRVIDEVLAWQGHAPEVVQHMLDLLPERKRAEGVGHRRLTGQLGDQCRSRPERATS